MNEKKSIFDLISVDEQRLSALILCLILLAGITGYYYLQHGDISGNMKDLIETIAYLVAGINIFNKWKG